VAQLSVVGRRVSGRCGADSWLDSIFRGGDGTLASLLELLFLIPPGQGMAEGCGGAGPTAGPTASLRCEPCTWK